MEVSQEAINRMQSMHQVTEGVAGGGAGGRQNNELYENMYEELQSIARN